VSQNAQVADVTSNAVRLSFTTQALANTFEGGPHADYLREAISQTLGADLLIDTVSGKDQPGSSASDAGPKRANGSGPVSWDAPTPAALKPEPETPDPVATPQDWTQRLAQNSPTKNGSANATSPHNSQTTGPATTPTNANNGGGEPASTMNGNASGNEKLANSFVEDEPSDDDEILEDSGLAGPDLVAEILGGTVIEEIIDEQPL